MVPRRLNHPNPSFTPQQLAHKPRMLHIFYSCNLRHWSSVFYTEHEAFPEQLAHYPVVTKTLEFWYGFELSWLNDEYKNSSSRALL